MRVQVVNIEAASADTGADLLQRAIADLGVWGGMSEGVSRNDDLNVSISFDPRTAGGGYAAVLSWLEELGIEFTATFSAWEND